MRAIAILPIKRFGNAKSRLTASAAADLRAALAEAMLADVLAHLGSSELIERTVVVSGEPAARALATAAGADLLDDPDDAGHSQAAAIGVDMALAGGAGCAALLPGDCPLLRAAELDEALASMSAGVAVIPDRHGTGTNGLLLAPPDAIAPAFGPGSLERHLVLAADADIDGWIAEIPSLALDLDTGSDLRELVAVLRADPDLAPRTAAALALLAEPRL